MGIEWGWDNARAILGLFVIVGIAWALSENRKVFPWKIVLGATAMMYVVILLLFWLPIVFAQFGIPGGNAIRDGLNGMNNWIDVLIAATREGTKFVFGPFIGDQTAWEKLVGANGPIFIFQLLPLIIVIGSLSAILWHWGILKVITRAFAAVFKRTMGISGPTSLSVAANIFMGQTEAPLLIKPYLRTMTRSELLIVMSTGFATIAGSVLVVYVTLLRPLLPNVLIHLLTVSIIASPAAVALSLIMVPETGKSGRRVHRVRVQVPFDDGRFRDRRDRRHRDHLEHRHDADRSSGAGLHRQRNPRLDPVDIGGQRLSLDMILGWLFAPLMYVAGVPLEEAAKAGTFVGQKTVFTEFVAFINLGNLPAAEMTERTRTIVTYAICGFANFGSMGILIGGLSIMCPERRPDFLALAWKTLYAGTLATIMAAAVVGSLPYALFKADQSLAPVAAPVAAPSRRASGSSGRPRPRPHPRSQLRRQRLKQLRSRQLSKLRSFPALAAGAERRKHGPKAIASGRKRLAACLIPMRFWKSAGLIRRDCVRGLYTAASWIALTSAMVAVASPALAQTTQPTLISSETPPPPSADVVTIYGDRVPTDPGAFSVVDEKKIQDVAANHPAEILNTVPGVNVQMNSGQELLVAIRSPVLPAGAGQGSFLILEDGVPTRAPGFGNVNALFEVHHETAEAIEVVRGPGSVRYGSNAEHGLMNFIDPEPGAQDGQSLTVSANTLQRYRADATTNFDMGDVANWIGLSVMKDGGWRDASGVDQQKLTWRSKFGGENWNAVSTFSAVNLNQETAGFIQGTTPTRTRTSPRLTRTLKPIATPGPRVRMCASKPILGRTS